jgi:hypothetical protein
MEHRWGPRRDIDQAIHVWTPTGTAAAGQLRNVSSSGGYIETSLPVEPLMRVKVQLKLSGPVGHGSSRLKAEGHVVRVGRDGFAVEWCEFAPPAIRALIQLARSQALLPTSGFPARLNAPDFLAPRS